MDIAWFYSTTAGIIVSIGGVLTALIPIWKAIKWLYKSISKAIKQMMAFTHIIERQNVLETKIDRILGELTHNGGHSTKDVVKAVSESVIRLESRQQAMLDAISSSQGMFECTLFGDFLWVSRNLCYMLGKTKEDLLGKAWVGSVSYKHRQKVMDEWNECLDQQREFMFHFDMTKADGEYLKVEMKTTKIVDYTGKQIGFFGTISEVE